VAPRTGSTRPWRQPVSGDCLAFLQPCLLRQRLLRQRLLRLWRTRMLEQAR